jgi:DNA-binding beta-propeller fold protein YncE
VQRRHGRVPRPRPQAPQEGVPEQVVVPVPVQAVGRGRVRATAGLGGLVVVRLRPVPLEGDEEEVAAQRLVEQRPTGARGRPPRPLVGLAGALVLAPAPDGDGPRLYAIELAAATSPEESAGDGARLLRLDAATLAVERAYPLGFRPRGLAVAPDDERAYALAGAEGRLVELDLRGGAQRRLAVVPGAAPGLAVAGPHLYVPDPAGGAVLVLDRRTGDLVARVRVGQRPAGVLAALPAGAYAADLLGSPTG